MAVVYKYVGKDKLDKHDIVTPVALFKLDIENYSTLSVDLIGFIYQGHNKQV